jgi:hypothetical protein
MKRLAFLVFLSAAAAFAAERQPFERYRSIVDRQMFGALPKDFDPTKMPSEVSKSSSRKELTKEQEKLQRSIHFSVINVAADGTPVVGFTDNGDPKAPVHHYVKVGEESGGWKVVAADLAESCMTVEKDGVELTLRLGDKSGGGGGSSRAQSAEHAPAVLPAAASAHAGEAPARSSLLGGSLRSRRAMRVRRQEEERKQQEEERARLDRDREEMRQQLQAIRDEQVRLREEKEAAAAKTAAESKEEPANENNDAQ